jgi:hypothetical protein
VPEAPEPTKEVAESKERGARDGSCPAGEAITGGGVWAIAPGVNVVPAFGSMDPMFLNVRAAPFETAGGGSPDFGAVTVAAALVIPIDCCGRRINIPCWTCVGAMCAVDADPARIPAPPPLEPPLREPPPSCALAGSIVSASIARAAISSNNELANLHVNMTVPAFYSVLPFSLSSWSNSIRIPPMV